MCGRFSLAIIDLATLADLLEAEFEQAESALYHPRFNIAPQTTHWIVSLASGKKRLCQAQWGFPSHQSQPLINARIETAHHRPAFREAFLHQRCVIPADGFYEWLKEGKTRRPFRFFSSKNKLLQMAGLFQEEGKGRKSFVILTTEANALVRPVHSRMPLLLSGESLTRWIAGDGLEEWRSLRFDELSGNEVPPWVNSVKNDGPECIVPLECPLPAPRQPTLSF